MDNQEETKPLAKRPWHRPQVQVLTAENTEAKISPSPGEFGASYGPS